MTDKPPRALGIWLCAALVVGNMIGSGVFLLPANLAPLGWNAVFGWIVTILGAMALAAVFAVLARALPKSGGPYAYTTAAFGPGAGFVVAWTYWIALWVGNAAIAVGGVAYLGSFDPKTMAIPGVPVAFTALVLWLLTGVNCLGVQAAGRLQLVTTVIKLVPLAAVIAIGVIILREQGAAAVLPFHAVPLSFGGINTAMTFTLWGLLGLESATIPSAHIEDPARTIPRATIIGTAVTGLIYLFACSAVTLLSDPETTAHSQAPIADFVAAHFGAQTGRIIALLAAVSAFGALTGWVLLQGEMPWAMAMDGVFPQWMAKLSSACVPVRAHVFSSVLATILLICNYSSSATEVFTFVVLLATSAQLVAYVACCGALLRMMRDGRITCSRWLWPIALFAGLYALWAIWGAGLEADLWGLVLLLAGVPVHLVMRRRLERSALA